MIKLLFLLVLSTYSLEMAPLSKMSVSPTINTTKDSVYHSTNSTEPIILKFDFEGRNSYDASCGMIRTGSYGGCEDSKWYPVSDYLYLKFGNKVSSYSMTLSEKYIFIIIYLRKE